MAVRLLHLHGRTHTLQEVWHELDTQTNLLHPIDLSCPVNEQRQFVLFTQVRFRTVPNFLHRNHIPACLPQLSAGNLCPNQNPPVSREPQTSAATGLALKEILCKSLYANNRFQRTFKTKTKGRKTFLGKERNFKSVFQKTNQKS